MRLEIYEPKVKDEKEQVVRLALKKLNNNIVLMAVDENGYEIHCGCLIHFYSNGEIFLAGCVNQDLGFELDKSGRIKIQKG